MEKKYEIPMREWHEATIEQLKEYEQICDMKVVLWTYFGSRSSGITYKYSSWCADFLYVTSKNTAVMKKNFNLTKSHRRDRGGVFDIELNGMNQDRYFTYQPYRGRNIGYCLSCRCELEEILYGLDLKKQVEMFEKSEQEQKLFFAFSPELYLHSPFVYGKKEYMDFMRRCIESYYNEKLTLLLCMHLINKNYKMIKNYECISVHSYLYVFRAIFFALWTMEKKEFPPTDILSLIEIAESGVKKRIYALYELYTNLTDKKYKIKGDYYLNKYIEDMLLEIYNYSEKLNNQIKLNYELDEQIKEYFKYN